jgi:chromosomal replication initiation ATPase DnaA
MGTLKEIGAELNKDSSTVYEGIGTVERYVKTDSTFRRNFNNIKERIEDILEESEKLS